MRQRKIGIIILALLLSTFIASSVAATYSATDTYINTTYVKTASAGTTTMVASGNVNDANTVGVNTGTTKVLEVKIFRSSSDGKSTEFEKDYEVASQGVSLTVNIERDKAADWWFSHTVTKYNTTSTTNYSSASVVDKLYYLVYQY